MTRQEIINAIQFLQRIFVGQAEQEKLFRTIEALKAELTRRTKK